MAPLAGVPGQRGRPPPRAQLGGAHTRSPVLSPRVFRSRTVSGVRPGHSPALSTPMFPGGPGPRQHLGCSPRGHPRGPLLPGGSGRGGGAWGRVTLGVLRPGPAPSGRAAASGFQVPGTGLQRHPLAAYGATAAS